MTPRDTAVPAVLEALCFKESATQGALHLAFRHGPDAASRPCHDADLRISRISHLPRVGSLRDIACVIFAKRPASGAAKRGALGRFYSLPAFAFLSRTSFIAIFSSA